MAEWNGWSDQREQVEITRAVRLLFADVGPGGMTTRCTAEVVADLGTTGVDADELAMLLLRRGLVDSQSLSVDPATDSLMLTDVGHQVRDEFQQMAAPRERNRAARRAELMWFYDHTGAPNNMLLEPYSWFYGQQFTDEQLNVAAGNLVERGLLDAQIAWGNDVINAKLTAKGIRCVEIYDGDPDEMERSVSTGVSIGTFNQHDGNTAIGSTGFSQTSISQVSVRRTTEELADVVRAIRAMGWVPEDQHAEADGVESELRAVAASDSIDPEPALTRAQRLIASVNSISGNPLISPVLTALGSYAAVRAGLPTS
jgi:hypothetical protein